MRIKKNDNSYSFVSKFEIFKPQNLTGLKGWFSAIDIDTINNSRLNHWESSNNNEYADNSIENRCPIFYSGNGLNNRPYLSFSPPKNYLTSTINGDDVANTDPLNVYFLGNLYQQNVAYGFIFTLGNFGVYSPSNQNRGAYNYNSSAQFAWASNGGQTYFLTASCSPYSLINVIDNTESAELYKNGTLINSGIAEVYETAPEAPLIIGSRPSYDASSSVASAKMDVEEILIFNVEHDSFIRSKINHYLYQRYIPPLSLGKDTTISDLCSTLELTIPDIFYQIEWNDVPGGNSYIVNESGKYYVNAVDIFGNFHSDTIEISINEIIYPENTFICDSESVNWSPTEQTNNYNFNWSNGLTTSSVQINSPQELSVIISDSLGCFLYSDTITFLFDTFSSNANLGGIDTTICEGGNIGIGSFSSELQFVEWSNGETNADINIFDSGEYSIIAINENDCEFRDTISINIEGIAPVVSFEVNGFCQNDGIELIDESTLDPLDTIDSWEWRVNDNLVSEDSVSFTFETVPGLNIISLLINTHNGCSSIFYDSIFLVESPVSQFETIGYCMNDWSSKMFLFNLHQLRKFPLPIHVNWLR